MSELNLASLAEFATKATVGSTRVPTFELSIEEARAKVVVKDANKKPAANGSQDLVCTLGQKNLSLDVIAKGATRISATVEQVKPFTELLQAEVAKGTFDEAIIEAQDQLRKSNEERRARAAAAEAAGEATKEALEAEEAAVEDGLDLDSIED